MSVIKQLKENNFLSKKLLPLALILIILVFTRENKAFFFYIPNFIILLLVLLIFFIIFIELREIILAYITTKRQGSSDTISKKVFIILLVTIFLFNIYTKSLVINNIFFYVYCGLIFLAILFGSTLQFNNTDQTNSPPSKKKDRLANIILITIAALFIILKLIFPFFNSSSYADEYFHILSGIDFFETGHFSVFTSNLVEYTRGSYVSFFTGLVLLFLKNSLYAVKMIPALVGIINFFLLYKISKSFLNNKFYLAFLLIIYTISPYIIFNHFFIRFYVFQELFFLSLILSFILILEKKAPQKQYTYSWFLFALINIINWFFTNDRSKYFIVMASLIFLAYYLFNYLKIYSNYKIIQQINNKKSKLFLIGLGAIGVYFLFNIPEKIRIINNGILEFGAANQQFNYYSFFLNFNPILTILLIILLFNFIQLKKSQEKLLVLISISYLILFFSFNLEIQVIRVILFIIPIFYLLAVISLEKNLNTLEKKIILLILAMLFLNTISNYPKDFLKKVILPNEVTMHKYDQAGKFLAQNCIGKDVYILNHEPQIFYLYIKDKYTIFYIQKDLILNDRRYQYNRQGQFELVFKKIPVISDPIKIEKIIEKGNNCIVMNDLFENNWRYIEEKDFQKIKEKYQSNGRGEYRVYYK